MAFPPWPAPITATISADAVMLLSFSRPGGAVQRRSMRSTSEGTGGSRIDGDASAVHDAGADGPPGDALPSAGGRPGGRS